MYVYKITNLQNNKIYIGQTIYSIEKRFHRHIQDALSKRLDTHLARAIRKYGKESFTIEVIDTASTREELTTKESYWIQFLDSIKNGYNETSAEYRSGGNTYFSKSPEEMEQIKNKLSENKRGGKNPNATKVKCKSLITGVEKHFNSVSEMKDFFKAGNHSFITARCQGRIKCAYKREWLIAYEDQEYPNDATIGKNNRKSKRILVKNLDNLEEKKFQSYAEAERFFNLPLKYFSGKACQKGKNFKKGNFEITVLD